MDEMPEALEIPDADFERFAADLWDRTHPKKRWRHLKPRDWRVREEWMAHARDTLWDAAVVLKNAEPTTRAEAFARR